MTLSNKTLLHHGRFRKYVLVFCFFFETAISENSSEQLHVRKLYLLSYPSNYWCGRATQAQVSKLTWKNTAISSRTLVKSHKGLKVTERFARICFRKKLIWKTAQKINPKETIIKFFLQLSHNLQLHCKRTPWHLFSDDFWKKISEYCSVSEHW